MKTAECS